MAEPQPINRPEPAVAGAAKTGEQAGRENAAALIELLRIEGEARSVSSTRELAMLAANDVRKVTRARQIFVLHRPGGGALHVGAVTGLPDVDRTVPLVQWIERIAAELIRDGSAVRVFDFSLAKYAEAGGTTAQSYPMQNALWLPLKYRSGQIVAGILMTRDEPWSSNDLAISERLGITFSQAWYWIATSRRPSQFLAFTMKKTAAIFAAVAALGFVPVSLTAIAPAVLAPRNHLVITAPLDGVVADIPVASNEHVKPGQLLVKFEDTTLVSNLAVADREVGVAEARVKKTMLQAVNDISGRHELAIAKSELEVKTAEHDYAREILQRSQIAAPQAGVIIIGDKRDIIGRPLSTGEKILEIADPGQVELLVDVPVGDALLLKTGARVQAFLDSDPLHALEARVVRADYQAKVRETGTLSFRVFAEFENNTGTLPRLGTRGTAQLFGERVPLAYYIFRRPLTALRQWAGF